MKRNILQAFILVSFYFCFLSANSQTWITTTSYEFLFGITMNHDSISVGPWIICQTPDKSIYVAQQTDQDQHMEIVKLDSTGNTQWIIPTSHSGGIFHEYTYALHPCDDNGIVYSCRHDGGPPSLYDIIYKRNSNNSIEWTKTYWFPFLVSNLIPTHNNTTLIQFNDSLVEVDSQGNFIRQRSPFNSPISHVKDSDFIVARNLLSRETFAGQIIWSVPNGMYNQFYVDTSVIFLSSAYSDTIQKRQTSNGALIWAKPIKRGHMSVTSDMGLIGCSNDTISRYDSSGNLMWRQVTPFPIFGYSQIVQSSANQFITGGAYRCIDAHYGFGYIGYSSLITSLDSSGHGVVDSTNYFFAGNANDNNSVSFADDAAYVAVAMGATGSARAIPTSSSIYAVFATDWSQTFGNGINYKYTDATGDGIIDTTDISFYIYAWPYPVSVYSHWRMGSVNSNPELRLYMEEDTLLPGQIAHINIILGSSVAIDSVYAISITVHSQFVRMADQGIAEIKAIQFGDTATNMYSVYSGINYQSGLMNFLLARNDHQNAYVAGDTIARISFTTSTNSLPGLNPINCTATALTEKGYPVTLSIIGDSVFIPNTTSVYELSTTGIKIYPNPANNKLFVNSLEEKHINYKIFDTTGRLTQSGIAEREIDISSLETGNYLIEIISENNMYRRKIIKL